MSPGQPWPRRRAARVAVQAGAVAMVCVLYAIVVTRGRVIGWFGWAGWFGS